MDRLIDWSIDWLTDCLRRCDTGAGACTTPTAAAQSSRWRDVRGPRRTEPDTCHDHHHRHIRRLSESRLRQPTPLLSHRRWTVRLRQGLTLVSSLYTFIKFVFFLLLSFYSFILLFLIIYFFTFYFWFLNKFAAKRLSIDYSNKLLSARISGGLIWSLPLDSVYLYRYCRVIKIKQNGPKVK